MSDATDDGSDLAARAAELERRLAAVEQAARARVIAAELRAEAVRAGMIDLDALPLVDAAGVVLDDSGAVHGAAEAMRRARRAKPWLFAAASSSSTAQAPGAAAPRARLATEMGFEEWQAARREMLRRR